MKPPHFWQEYAETTTKIIEDFESQMDVKVMTDPGEFSQTKFFKSHNWEQLSEL
jgi:hypothetical protein